MAHGGTNSTVIAHLLGVEKEPWDWHRFAMGHAVGGGAPNSAHRRCRHLVSHCPR